MTSSEAGARLAEFREAEVSMLGQALYHREHRAAKSQFIFKIPNSRGYSESDSQHQCLTAAQDSQKLLRPVSNVRRIQEITNHCHRICAGRENLAGAPEVDPPDRH